MTTKEFTGDVDLQAQLERFYQDGQLAQAAVVAWMLSALKPNSPDWKIYRKKLLRETGAEGASVTEIVGASDQAFDSQQPGDGFAALALGLLAQPENSPLLKKMLDRARAFEQRNFITAALIQLKEEQTDPEVLNVLGAMAQEAERYEEAERFFSQLRKLRPESVEVRLNWTAALTGLRRYQEAVDELEWIIANTNQHKEALFRLVPLFRLNGQSVISELGRINDSYFSAPASAEKAATKALILTSMLEPEKAAAAYRLALGFEEVPGLRLDLSLIQMRLGDFSQGFINYRSRYAAVENLNWLEPGGVRWEGQPIASQTLLVWAEQGVGDEIFFGFMLEPIKQLCSAVTLVVDGRLVSSFSMSFPDWVVISRTDALERKKHEDLDFDYEVSMGELMALFSVQQIAEPPSEIPLFAPNAQRIEEVKALLGDRKRPRIAISWSGGTAIDGKSRSMNFDDIVNGLPEDADVDIISVQYTDEAEKEIKAINDFRFRCSGLDNREDLEGVLALLSQVEAVITVDNSVAHLAQAVGTPSCVLVPGALAQFRLKNEMFRNRYFPNVSLMVRSESQTWAELAAEAWNRVMSWQGKSVISEEGCL